MYKTPYHRVDAQDASNARGSGLRDRQDVGIVGDSKMGRGQVPPFRSSQTWKGQKRSINNFTEKLNKDREKGTNCSGGDHT